MPMITAEPKADGFNIVQVIEVIKSLANSQGFYQRMLERILYIEANEPEQYESFKNEMESQNFKDAVDVVLYLES